MAWIFGREKKLQLCTDTKVENFASCPKVACFLGWLGVSARGCKRGHNDHRVAILESALFRVLSPFSAKLPLMMIVWTCAFKQTYQRLAKLLTAYDQNNTEFSPRAALENDAANCNLLGLENQPKLFSSILHLISFWPRVATRGPRNVYVVLVGDSDFKNCRPDSSTKWFRETTFVLSINLCLINFFRESLNLA